MREPRPLRNRAVVAGAALLLTAGLASCSSGSGTPASSSAPATAATTDAPTAAAAPTTPAPVDAKPLAMNADGKLGGNATVREYPAGDPGVLSVVEVGPFDKDQSILPIVFRNNTKKAVSHVDISGTAHGADGTLTGTGTSQGTTPAQIPPGGLSLGYIYMKGAPPAADAKWDFTFETSEADTSSYNTGDLKVTEAALSGTAVVGTAVNGSDATLTGPFSVGVYCFDAAGKLLSHHTAFADQDADQAPGAKVSFSAELFDHPCPTFLVGVDGYFA